MIHLDGVVATIEATGKTVLDGVEMSVESGATATLTGPSGSGKSVLAQSLLGWARAGISITGTVRVDGQKPLELNPKKIREFRRHIVGYVDQDPAVSLNPHRRIKSILADLETTKGEGQQWAQTLGLPINDDFLRRRSTQLSGGQRRRIALARHAAARPRILILDEPSAGLDAAARKSMVEALDELRAATRLTMVVITHDHDFAEQLRPEHRFSLLNGRVRLSPSRAATVRVSHAPANPAPDKHRIAQPRHEGGRNPLLRVRGLTVTHSSRTLALCEDIDLDINAGAGLALVGPSGAGKTTIARAILGVHRPVAGTVDVGGHVLASSVMDRTPDQRRLIGYLPQDPAAALNPRTRIGSAIGHAVRLAHPVMSATAAEEQVDRLAEQVGLESALLHSRPAQLSGGQRQRACIARALAVSPKVLICDEVASALDESSTARVLELLRRLCAESNLALLVITHQDTVARTLCDRVFTLNGSTEDMSGRRDSPLPPQPWSDAPYPRPKTMPAKGKAEEMLEDD